MNSNDLARTKALAADLYEMQPDLKDGLTKSKPLADENETAQGPECGNRPPAARANVERPDIRRTAPPVVMDVKEGECLPALFTPKLRDLIATRTVRHARIGAKIVIRRNG